MQTLVSPRVQQIIDDVEKRRNDPNRARRILYEQTLDGTYQPTSAKGDDPTAIYPTSAFARQSLEHLIPPLCFFRLMPKSELQEMITGNKDVSAIIPDKVKDEIKREASSLVDKIFDYLQQTPHARDEMTEDLFLDTARVVINGYLGDRVTTVLGTIAENIIPRNRYMPFAEVMLATYLLEQGLRQGVLHEYFAIPNRFLADASSIPRGKLHRLVFYGTLPQIEAYKVRVYAGEGTPAHSTLLQLLPQFTAIPIDQQPVLVQTGVMKREGYERLIAGQRQPTRHDDCYVLHITPHLLLDTK